MTGLLLRMCIAISMLTMQAHLLLPDPRECYNVKPQKGLLISGENGNEEYGNEYLKDV